MNSGPSLAMHTNADSWVSVMIGTVHWPLMRLVQQLIAVLAAVTVLSWC